MYALTHSSLAFSGLLVVACHQEPQPATPPTFTFSRRFEAISANQTLAAIYPLDSLIYRATRLHHNLRIELAPKQQRQGNDAIIIRVDSAALLPGLVGEYKLPPLDTVTYSQLPSSVLVFYQYTTVYSASQRAAQAQSLYNFLPGSYLSITAYDAARQTVSGRFEFRFPIWDPTQTSYVINPNWRATVRGDFTDLPIEQ